MAQLAFKAVLRMKSIIISVHAESIILSVSPAESIILSAGCAKQIINLSNSRKCGNNGGGRGDSGGSNGFEFHSSNNN